MFPRSILHELLRLNLAGAVTLPSGISLRRLILRRVAHLLIVTSGRLGGRTFGRVEGII
jgi:hypothetical protein